ncbi:hypothetical protein GCM10027445_10120 [Amycolatopsis endophytica]|uniref:Molybdopterin converting factor small subunit n=1 Tax=Amycolatopsis endophytica TaxID=860233 RepID=A0A853AX47_9PSEU|nr:hypothetical protein [Amycolatopsis endophytica]NYI87248.1 molybdopterin converting factor small subunit [Amycolatopsis endophytica]
MPSRFDAIADELYALPRDEFTSARTERAKQVKARRPDLAKRIARLRKPTVSAWLVNQVGRRHASEVEQLADLGGQLRSAHQKLAGDELRSLSRERNELIRRLSGFAGTIAAEAGVTYSDSAERQVEATFEAAVSDPDAAAEVRAGRLSGALTPSSSEDWLASALAASPRKRAPAPKKEPAPKKAREDPDAKRRQAALEEAREKADAAASARDEAHNTVEELTTRADEAGQTVADLRARLDEAVRDERAARKELFAARKAVTSAEKTANEARRRLSEMESFGRKR